MKLYQVAAIVGLLCCVVLSTELSQASLFEQFGDGWDGRWIKSNDEKYTGTLEVSSPEGHSRKALKIPLKEKYYGYSTMLQEPFNPSQGITIQYELKYSETPSCGGAYLKLVSDEQGFSPENFVDTTPYTIMFGPDKCGSTNKVHLILRHKSPKTGEIEEKHLKNPPRMLTDELTHVYTAIINKDNTFSILVDGKEESKGSLTADFDPSINPPETIADPDDKKPEDWVDEEMIPDPSATKPDDWDEDAPEEIPDPEASQPEDWNTEEDGEFEAPMIKNPEYKGKWEAPYVKNPDYKGPWLPRDIANPNYFNDKEPLTNIAPIRAIALEIWTMDQDYYFSNLLLTQDPEHAKIARDTYFAPIQAEEQAIQRAKEAELAKNAPKGKATRPVRDMLEKIPKHEVFMPTVARALDYIDTQPWLIVAIPAAFILIVFLGLVVCLWPSGQANMADRGMDKKMDVTGEDDDQQGEDDEGDEDDDEEDEEEEEVTEKVRRRKA